MRNGAVSRFGRTPSFGEVLQGSQREATDGWPHEPTPFSVTRLPFERQKAAAVFSETYPPSAMQPLP